MSDLLILIMVKLSQTEVNLITSTAKVIEFKFSQNKFINVQIKLSKSSLIFKSLLFLSVNFLNYDL